MTRPPNDADWDKLARHVAGESSAAEAGEMRSWLAKNPAEARAIEKLLEQVRAAGPAAPVDVEAALRRVKRRLEPTWSRYLGWGAAAALVLVAGSYALRLSRGTEARAPMTIATSTGQRDSVVLADGSRILLGPASRVTIRDRDVELTGEAYFVVTHDERRPFTVHAGDALIRDLGTEFSVHSDEGLKVRVVVREGSVNLARGADSVVLAAGDVGVLSESGGMMARRGEATDDDVAWTRGRLVFRDAPVREIAADLRRWYGVELVVTDTVLLRRHFSGSFTTEPVGRVVGDIAIALGARVEQAGDTVRILRVRAPRR